MPRGHAVRREGKKPKKKDDKRAIELPPVLTSAQVEVTGKRKKAKAEE